MENFSIARDEQTLIPYVRAALDFRPDLRLWAIPWSPPAWMKTNGSLDDGSIRDEPQVLEAYALYFARYVEAYGDAGFEIEAIAIQNDPSFGGDYPTCLWTPELYQRFETDYLVPTFAARDVPADLWLGAFGDPPDEAIVTELLADADAVAAASAVALQYVDRDTGLPHRSSLDAAEGGYRHSDTTRFDREAGTASVRQRGKFDNTVEVAVPKETVDFVALVVRLRNLPLEPGGRHEFHVLTGKRLSRIVAEVAGRETVSTRAGSFPAVKVKVPTGLTGKFSEKNPTFVWFSDDARRIVVRITTDFSIGHATAGLVAYVPGRPAAE
jgi:hypothetical protein